MSSSADHARLVRAILAELGALPGVVMAANASGRARYVSDRGRVHFVPYGWPTQGGGGPDILAVVAPLGRLIGLEVKTGRARLRKDQRAVHDALRRVGVAVHVVRSVEEARDALGTLVKNSSIHADLTRVMRKNDDLRRGRASRERQSFTP